MFQLSGLEEQLGVRTVQTPQDVIQQADITFSCVSDITAVKKVSYFSIYVKK